MPNRIIKESICTSENIDELSTFQETFFYRLIVNCDDYGRMDARPKILASRLYPLKDIRSAQIEDALRALSSAELVILYEVDGKPFLQMKTWDRHQQVRAKRSKYPSPDAGICLQMISNDSKCPRNPIQSESESNPNPNPAQARKNAPDEKFDKFWAAYPNKKAKQDAFRAFQKLKPDDDLLNRMLAALEREKESAQWQESGGRFIPHPATWLNGRRWEDETTSPTPAQAAKHVVAQDYPQRDYEIGSETPDQVYARLFGDAG